MRLGRLHDIDKRFGPLTIGFAESGKDTWDAIYVHYSTVSDRDDNGEYVFCNTLTIRFGRFCVARLKLPAIVKPRFRRVKAAYWDKATIERLGRDWYEEVDERKYGFTWDDYLTIYYGPNGDSIHDRFNASKTFSIPWKEWTIRKVEYLDLDGKVLNVAKTFSSEMEIAMPRHYYYVKDLDGTIVVAGFFESRSVFTRFRGKLGWLGDLLPKREYRRLDIEFSEEVGRGKGSWKGGTLAMSTPIQDDDDSPMGRSTATEAFVDVMKQKGLSVIRPLTETETEAYLAEKKTKEAKQKETVRVTSESVAQKKVDDIYTAAVNEYCRINKYLDSLLTKKNTTTINEPRNHKDDIRVGDTVIAKDSARSEVIGIASCNAGIDNTCDACDSN